MSNISRTIQTTGSEQLPWCSDG